LQAKISQIHQNVYKHKTRKKILRALQGPGDRKKEAQELVVNDVKALLKMKRQETKNAQNMYVIISAGSHVNATTATPFGQW
jgi:hypothetical protein